MSKNVIEITVDGPSVIKAWWYSAKVTSLLTIFDSNGNIVEQCGDENGTLHISEIAIYEAGTYYIGFKGTTCYLHNLEVTVLGNSDAPETPENPEVPETPDEGDEHTHDVYVDQELFEVSGTDNRAYYVYNCSCGGWVVHSYS